MKRFRYLWVSVVFGCVGYAYAGLTFSGPGARFAILPSARLYLGEVNSISGWTRQSIVQTNGNNSPTDWDPYWVDGTNVLYEIAPEAFSPKNEGDITTDAYSYELTTDLSLGPNRTLTFVSSTLSNYTFVNGNGYIINLSEGFPNLIQIEAGHTVEIANAVIKNYDENSIVLGVGAVLKFLNTTIEFTDNRTITRELDLSGDIIINGYGYTLSFDTGASLNLVAGQLAINNLSMYGIGWQNLKCSTANGTIILQNASLILTDNFRYKLGGLIAQDTLFSGFYGFNYESSLTFSIFRTVTMDSGFTFSYSPSVNRRDLIYMEPTSQIYLNGCTLASTTTGMRLTKGTLIVDSQNLLYNTGAVSISQGIAFGDLNPDHNLGIEILPGAKLELMSGKLIYQNSN